MPQPPPPATPHLIPRANIDLICGDAIAVPLASFFRIDLRAYFALLSRPGEMVHGMLPPCADVENGAAPSVPPARARRHG